MSRNLNFHAGETLDCKVCLRGEERILVFRVAVFSADFRAKDSSEILNLLVAILLVDISLLL